LVRELRRLVLDPKTKVTYKDGQANVTHGDVTIEMLNWYRHTIKLNGCDVYLYMLPCWRLWRAVQARIYADATAVLKAQQKTQRPAIRRRGQK